MRTFFFPTIWLADHISILNKFLLFLSLNILALSYLSISYLNELEHKVQINQEKIEVLTLNEALFSLVSSLQRTRAITNARLRGDKRFNGDLQELYEQNLILAGKLDKLFKQSWIDTKLTIQWKRLYAFVHAKNFFSDTNTPHFIFESFSYHIGQAIQLIHTLAHSSSLFIQGRERYYFNSLLLYDILPPFIETHSQMRGLGTGILAEKKITADQKKRLSLLKHTFLLQLRQTKEYMDYYDRSSDTSKHKRDKDLRVPKSIAMLDKILLNEDTKLSNKEYFDTFTETTDSYILLHRELNKELSNDLMQIKQKQKQHLFLSYAGIATLIFLLVYLLIGLLISTRFFVKSFLDTTQKVIRGELSSRLNIATKNEYGEIAKGLNTMIENLEQNTKMIDQYIDTSQTDLRGIITSVSSAFARHSGYSKEELIGSDHNILRHAQTPDSLYTKMWAQLVKGETWEGEIRDQHKDGSDLWVEMIITPKYDEKHRHIGYISIRRDITNQKNIEELSITDYLTQVYNRKYFNENLKKAISLYQRYHTPFTLLMFDVDNFKKINDSYGHLVGDECLIQLCALIKTHLRDNDLLARWGGEEFMVLLPHINKDEAINIAQKLRSLVDEHTFEDVSKMTVSFGVASFLENDSFDTILERTDRALYQAKDKGRNKVVFL